MARLPLEDNFTDVIAKAQTGLRITDEQLATRAEKQDLQDQPSKVKD